MADYRDWFRSATGRRVTAEEIATALGVSRATATRRLVDGMDPGDVIKLSRALRVNPVEALVDLGHLTHGEAMDFLDSDGQLVDTAEDGELAIELARRLNPATRAPEIDELAARRSNTPPADVSPLAYVADSSPDEPEMGDDGYHDGP